MKKELYKWRLTLLIIFISGKGSQPAAQTVDEWTWMNGQNTAHIATTTVSPGSRSFAATWTDASGGFWLFGGEGFDNLNAFGELYDLWKYDVVSNTWTLMNGNSSSGAAGVYGVKGIAAAANHPGSRHYAVTWKDAAGGLWLFGGNGFAASGTEGYLNDLWKYDIATGLWTWVNGDSIANDRGVYGAKGIPGPANSPGARLGSAGWTDASGNYWLFGGTAYDGMGGNGQLNDLWKYNMATGQWTWMSGDNKADAVGVYGVQGGAAAGNTPGGRFAQMSWSDGNYLWLFGGMGHATGAGVHFLNDLWKYDIATGQWTWMSGDSVNNALGIYGTKGTTAAIDQPGARYESFSWIDSDHDLWLYGGDGYSGSGSFDGFLNDLWKYDPATGEWTWVNGDNTTFSSAVYGTQGIAAASNQPGPRLGSISWIAGNNDLWLLGGSSSSGFLNDLWVYRPNMTTLASDFLNLSAVCDGNTGVLSWDLSQERNSGTFSVQRSPNGSHWQVIRSLTAFGQSGNCHYSFIDTDIREGLNYYRIQQQDAGGWSYSRIVLLKWSSPSSLKGYAVDGHTIKAYLLYGGNEPYMLTGMDGKVCRRGRLSNGQVTLYDLTPGVYVLQVMGSNGMLARKISTFY